MTSHSENLVNIICRKVIQNNVEFLVGSITAKSLVELVSVTHRAITGFDDDGKPLYNKFIQRRPSKSRVNSIKDYLILDKFASFPNNLLISVPSILLSSEIILNEQCETFTVSINKSKIDLVSIEEPLYLQIFDGQHRFCGMQEALNECRTLGNFEKLENLENFEFVVSLFIDAEIDFQAMMFSVINRTPVKVTQDLVFDLFGLTDADSPQKTALAIALELNGTKINDKGIICPFYKRIRLLAKKEKGINSPLSQGMFIKEIIKLISPTLNDAEKERMKSREEFSVDNSNYTIFRKAYSENKDFIIFKTIFNFFVAVRDSFVTDDNRSYWDFDQTPDNPLQRTIGFQALIKVLVVLFPVGMANKNLSIDFFKTKLSRVKEIELIDYKGQTRYQYSSVGVNKLRDDILEKINLV